jgi:hypothetical protein
METTMSNRDQFQAYLRHYAAKHLDAIAAMFADATGIWP